MTITTGHEETPRTFAQIADVCSRCTRRSWLGWRYAHLRIPDEAAPERMTGQITLVSARAGGKHWLGVGYGGILHARARQAGSLLFACLPRRWLGGFEQLCAAATCPLGVWPFCLPHALTVLHRSC